MYRRVIAGATLQGQTRQFIEAMGAAGQYQEARGLRVRSNVWGALTGASNSVLITGDFENLAELDRFEDMVEQEREFAKIRGQVRANMTFESDLNLWRLAYNSDGSLTSESTTATRRFLRMLTGDIHPGKAVEFVRALQTALEYQDARGVDTNTSIWRAVTGKNPGAIITSEFDSLAMLEKFEDLVAHDAAFGEMRRAVRSAMVFGTANVSLHRKLL